MKPETRQIQNTPAPWKLNSDGDTVHGGRHNLPIARVLMPSTGAWDGAQAEQFEANARLISAAPELLAALKRAQIQALRLAWSEVEIEAIADLIAKVEGDKKFPS